MPSPRRTSRLFRCTKWACTILAGVMVVAWVGSGWYACWWERQGQWPHFSLFGHKGAISGAVGNEQFFPNLVPGSFNEFRWAVADPLATDLAWAWKPRWHSEGNHRFYVVIPLWLPALVFAVPAAWMWRVDVKRRRAARVGCCATCGYSLLGLGEGAACPECGVPHSGQTGDAPEPRG